MSFEPNKIEKKHVLDALAKIDSNRAELIPSTRWLVEVNGKTYPPKEIMRAARLQYDNSDDWAYGGGPPTNKFLERMGFKIIDMNSEYNPMLDLIKRYKSHIKKESIESEIYKWQLVEKYQGKPDPEVSDFEEEIRSLNFGNLIYHNAVTAMRYIAKQKQEPYRGLFKMLYDEEINLSERINRFDKETEKLFKSLFPEDNLSHHHDERTTAAFLTFRYPNKYTFYKDSYYKKFCQLLKLDSKSKGQKYIHYLNLIHEFVDEYVSKDEELLEIISEQLPEDTYPDEGHLLLAQDILYTVLEKNIGMKRKYWRIGTSADENSYWEVMKENDTVAIGWSNLGDLDVLDIENKNDIIKAFDVNSIEFSNTQTKSRKAGEIFDFYLNVNLGDVVIAQDGMTILGIGIITDGYNFNKSEDFAHEKGIEWRILNPPFTNKKGLNTTCFKITDFNLISMIDRILDEDRDSEINSIKGLHMSKKEKKLNQILYGPPGTGKTYKLQDTYFEKFTVRESSLSRKQYLENLISELTWWQVITIAVLDLKSTKINELYKHELIQIKEGLSKSTSVKQTLWGQLQTHTVIECDNVKYKGKTEPLYFWKDEKSVWTLDEELVREIYPEAFEILEKSKTYEADPDKQIKNYEFITFHQSFSYEDFVEGIKPKLEEQETDLSYEIKDGIFKKLCLKATADPDNQYAIFIDEINRGNVSAIFGELITLIEDDKRIGEENELWVKLPYSKKDFGVPPNLYIIGTMNTADRSVEALDTALRRRFTFEEIMPLPHLLRNSQFKDFNLEEVLQTINERIEALLDRDHTIGHSYFIKIEGGDVESLEETFQNKIIPLLQEYFYHDYEKIALILGEGFVERKEGRVTFAKFPQLDEPELNPSFEIKKNIDDIEAAIWQLLNRGNEEAT